jgi:hypothetical protein
VIPGRQKQSLLTLWVLLGALILHLAAPVVYYARLSSIRTAQRALLLAPDKKKPEIIYVAAADFKEHYDRGEHELEIGGKRYDVAHYERKGAMVMCVAIEDRQEQELTNEMRHHASDQNKTRDEQLPIWYPTYWQEPFCLHIRTLQRAGKDFRLPADERMSATNNSGIDTPPPECGTYS